MKTRFLLGWAVLGLAACTEISDPVHLTGRVNHADGSPAAHVSLGLTSDAPGFGLTGCQVTMRPVVETDASGRYDYLASRAELLGVQEGFDDGRLNTSRDLQLCVLPPAGQKRLMSIEFLFTGADVALPTIQEWTGSLAATVNADQVELTFQDLDQAQHAGPLEYDLEVDSGGFVVLHRFGVSSPVSISFDALGGFASSATLTTSWPIAMATLHYTTDAIALPSMSTGLVSQGAGCTVGGQPQNPCKATDGSLAVNYFAPASDVTVHLKGPTKLRKAVVIGIQSEIGSSDETGVIEGSTDNSTWVTLAQQTGQQFGPDAELDLDASAPAVEWVRVRKLASDEQLSQLNEFQLYQ